MDLNRFFVGWLLVAGLVGVYAESDDEDSSEKLTTWIAPRSKYRTLDESASAPNPTNENSSAATDVFGFVNEAGSRENFNPGGSTSRVSQEDYDWYFKKGEEVLRRLSDETNKKRAKGEWLDPQMQSHHRRIPLDESASAPNPTNEDSSAATDVFGFVNEAGSRENFNPGGSTSRVSQENYDWYFKKGEEVLRRLSDETNKKRANGEWLDPQMQSHHRRIPLDESASAANPTNEDFSAATDVFGFVSDAGSRKNLNPGGLTSRMSQEDYDWHFKEGEEVLRSLSDETNNKRANGEWLDPQMQFHHRRIPGESMWDDWYPISIRDRIPAELDAFERAAFDKREGQSTMKERVPEKELNKPGPSRQETSKEKANRERLDRQMQAHGKKILDQRISSQESFGDSVKNPMQSQHGYAESAANLASPFNQRHRMHWTLEEKNIVLEEFKEYIDAKKRPQNWQVKAAMDKHPLLRNRSVSSIRTWIIKWIRAHKKNVIKKVRR